MIVGKSSDRYQNLLDVLGVAEESELKLRKLHIMDLTDAPCDLLLGSPDAILICGQNRRFEARHFPDLVELRGFSGLPDPVKERVRRRSANALFISERAVRVFECAPEAIVRYIRASMTTRWTERFDDLLGQVATESEFDSLESKERREATARIIFETYRFGTPRW